MCGSRRSGCGAVADWPGFETSSYLWMYVSQILDSVRVHELPSAAGLILKLANQSSGPARLAAVKAVRQKLRLTPQAMTPGVLDAFRLVVMQHADVAQEVVEGVDRQCGNLAANGSSSQVRIRSMVQKVPVQYV